MCVRKKSKFNGFYMQFDQFIFPIFLNITNFLYFSFSSDLHRTICIDRIQAQIENKITTIVNVIDMLSGIIEKDRSQSPESSDDSSPERLKTKVIESLIQRQNSE